MVLPSPDLHVIQQNLPLKIHCSIISTAPVAIPSSLLHCRFRFLSVGSELNWMGINKWPIKPAGPMIPPMFLDKRLGYDKDYGLNFIEPSSDVCMNWLDSKEPGPVVYVSFGSLAAVGEEQMAGLAWGLN